MDRNLRVTTEDDIHDLSVLDYPVWDRSGTSDFRTEGRVFESCLN